MYSHEQSAFISSLSSNTGHHSLTSVAGSGKTHTIIGGILALERALPTDRITIPAIRAISFNRAAAQELQSRLSRSSSLSSASTFHSLGLEALRILLKGRPSGQLQPKIDSSKMRKIILLLTKNDSDAAAHLSLLTSYARNNALTSLNDPDLILSILESEGLPTKDADVPKLARLTGEALSRSLSIITSEGTVDFDDMIWGALFLEAPFPYISNLLVDEAQDLNSSQHALISVLSNNAQVAIVGDPYQAIYGFRGADYSSFSTLSNLLTTLNFQLTYSYRCPQRITELARDFCPLIRSLPSSPEGHISHSHELDKTKALPHSSVILCRTNAPLLRLGIKYIKNSIPVSLRNRDIKSRLAFYYRMMQKKGLVSNLLSSIEHTISSSQRPSVRAMHGDYYDLLLLMIDQGYLTTISAVKDIPTALDILFTSLSSEQHNAVQLSTVHAAKGAEWDNVYILDPDNLPAPWARSSAAREQERNLTYVAYTRAKKNLHFLRSDASDNTIQGEH